MKLQATVEHSQASLRYQVMFFFYGIIIFATGLYELAHPLHPAPVLFSLHPSIWWGGFMGIAGAVYVIRLRPQKVIPK